MEKKSKKSENQKFSVWKARAESHWKVGFIDSAYNGTVIGAHKTKGAADRIASALNGVLRRETFQPKSAGRRARTKGHSFEREIAIQLRDIFPKARRHLEYQDAEANGVDLVETGRFRIQCKRLKKYASLTMIEEIQSDELSGEVPVLVTQGDGKPVLVALPLADFLCLLRDSRSKKA